MNNVCSLDIAVSCGAKIARVLLLLYTTCVAAPIQRAVKRKKNSLSLKKETKKKSFPRGLGSRESRFSRNLNRLHSNTGDALPHIGLKVFLQHYSHSSALFKQPVTAHCWLFFLPLIATDVVQT